MKRFFVKEIAILIISIAVVSLAIKAGSRVAENYFSPKPSATTTAIESIDAFAFSGDYQKRTFDINKKFVSEEYFPQSVKGELMNYTENELIGLRCSDNFTLNGQGQYGVYDSESQSLKSVIKTPELQSIIEETNKLTSEKPFVSGGFCELEDGRILHEQYKALTNANPANATDVTLYLIMKEKSKMTTPINVTKREMGPLFGCNAPLQVTTRGEVFYECGMFKDTSIEVFFYKIDLSSQISELIDQCTYPLNPIGSKKCLK